MRKEIKTFRKSFPTEEALIGHEQFATYLFIIFFWSILQLFVWYETNVDYSLICHFAHSSADMDKAVADYFDTLLGGREMGVSDLAITTKVMANSFSYTKEHTDVADVFRSERAVCLTWSYIEYVYLKSRGYKCYQVSEFINKAEKYPDHAVVCIFLDGEYYIADPTNDIFTSGKEYIVKHSLTDYWEKRLTVNY